MFAWASKLEVVYVGSGWTMENVTSSVAMFKGTNFPNYDSNYTDKTLAFAGFDEELERWGYLTYKS